MGVIFHCDRCKQVVPPGELVTLYYGRRGDNVLLVLGGECCHECLTAIARFAANVTTAIMLAPRTD